MPKILHPGVRLRAFREERGLSLREAARQLHVVHPALKDWEEGNQTPTAPYRGAIEVWTNGEIRASHWPLTGRELSIANNAALVRPVAIPADSSPAVADEVDDDIADESKATGRRETTRFSKPSAA